MQSADSYIEEGSMIETLSHDIECAREVLKQIPPKSWNLGG